MPPPNTPEEGLPPGHSQNALDTADTPEDAASSTSTPTTARAPARTPTPNVTVDLKALEYVDTVDPELVCPICHEPLLKPTLTVCDHTFCHECISHSWSIFQACPVDRAAFEFPIDTIESPKIIQNQLDNLKVRCPQSPAGCTAILSRSNVVNHVNKSCPFTPVKCPVDGCDRMLPRRDAERAGSNCLHFAIACEYCTRPVEYLDMSAHLDKDCPKSYISCPHCSHHLTRSAIEKHDKECPEATVPCRHAEIGCPENMKRRDQEKHLQTCAYVVLEKLGAIVLAQQEQVADLQRKDRDRERRIKAIEFRMMQSEHGPCSDFHPPRSARALLPPRGAQEEDMDNDRLEESRLSGENHELSLPPPYESRGQYLLALFESVDARVETLQKNLNDLEGRQAVLVLNETMAIKEQMAEMRSQVGVQGMHVRWLMNFRLQERNLRATNNMGGSTATTVSGNGNGNTSGPGSGDGDDGRGMVTRMSDALRENPPRL